MSRLAARWFTGQDIAPNCPGRGPEAPMHKTILQPEDAVMSTRPFG